MIDKQLKEQIDNMTYEEMLRNWRFSPAGSPLFIGETGDYFSKMMKLRREKVGNSTHVKASKNIGW